MGKDFSLTNNPKKFNSLKFILIFVFISSLIAFIIGGFMLARSSTTNPVKIIEKKNEVGQFCGGIAAIKCQTGYTCKLDGNYPDAGGKCSRND